MGYKHTSFCEQAFVYVKILEQGRRKGINVSRLRSHSEKGHLWGIMEDQTVVRI